MKKSISVVIPNFNGESLLKQNLPSVFEALSFASLEYEVIVSDDASSDNSILFLEKEFPEIKIVKNSKNQGFSKNINAGIQVATKDLVFALNSDVKLTKDYFVPILKYFDAEDTFGVMGRIVGLDNDIIQDSAKFPQLKGFNIKGTVNYLIENVDENFWIPSFFLSGANALIDRKKLQLLHGYDEIYSPFYFEDVDLSIRAWKLGWKSYYEHNSICRHPNSITITKYNKKKVVKVIATRNKYMLHALHLEGNKLFLWNTQLFLTQIFRSPL